jgi:D-sedoheptulose 7-phosphate isomerase
MTNWQTHINHIKEQLLSISVSDINGNIIDTDTAFKQLQNYALGVLERKKTIYFVGNGSNASVASDTASILAKNTGINTESFCNFALLTAVASDSGYEEIFAEPLRKKMVPGDMLVAISGSGESRNIINAAMGAQRTGGNICTLSAMNPNNTLKTLGSLNFYIPAENRLNASLCHMQIMNYWIKNIISIVYWQERLKSTSIKNDIINMVHNNFTTN